MATPTTATASDGSNNPMSFGRNRGGGSSAAVDNVRPCKYCGGKIKWLPSPDGALREDGTPKNVPFNAYPPFDRHKCTQYKSQVSQYKSMPNAQKAKGKPCMFGCGAMIMWSEDQKSVSGKYIPLELTGEPHQCPVKQQQYQQQQQQQQRPQQTAEPYPQSYVTTQQQQQQEQEQPVQRDYVHEEDDEDAF